MKFSEKIEKILKTNKLGVNTASGLEEFIGAGRGAISTPYREGTAPGTKTQKKIIEKMRISPDWWETGKGEIYLPAGEGPQQPSRDTLQHNFNAEVIKEAINQSMLEQLYKDLANFDKELDRAWALIDRLVPPAQSVKGITTKDR